MHPQITYRGTCFNLSNTPIGLAGLHQAENAAIAVALIETIHQRFPIAEDAVIRGLANSRWPCRLERVLDNPPVYIDVAHNPAGIQRLVESMPPCIIVFAASSDKNVSEMLRALEPITRELILTEFTGARALPVAQLGIAAKGNEFADYCPLNEAIARGLESASRICPLLITGSIFTAAQARAILIAHHNAAPLLF